MLNGVFEQPSDYIDNGNGVGRPVYSQGSARLRVQFEKVFEVDQAKSLLEGKEAFTSQDIILIQAAKDTNCAAHIVRDEHKARFPDQWRKFQQGQDGELGASITKLYGVSPLQVAQLHHFGIFTIQQLSEINDEILSQIPESSQLKPLAQVWLNSRQNEDESVSIIMEAQSYKARNAELEEQNKKLLAELEASKKSKAKVKAKSKAKSKSKSKAKAKQILKSQEVES
jgi:predicted flap endonuclease-1-like 5' DNA nuclease